MTGMVPGSKWCWGPRGDLAVPWRDNGATPRGHLVTCRATLGRFLNWEGGFWQQSQTLITPLISSNTRNPARLREECAAFAAGWAAWGG